MLKSIYSVLFSFFCALAWVGCSDNASPSSTVVAGADTYFPLEVGEARLRVQLALSRPEQQQGLMYRQEMASDAGMLFVFERAGQRSFWMRNTYLPLDILYIDRSGIVQEIYPMFPLVEESVVSRSEEIVMALEINQGEAQRQQISVGDKLNLSQVRKALVRRGWELAQIPWLLEYEK